MPVGIADYRAGRAEQSLLRLLVVARPDEGVDRAVRALQIARKQLHSEESRRACEKEGT